MAFFQKLRDRQTPYEPLITVRISREALLHNLATFRKLAPSWSCAPVLKSNAYGHGLLEVARILEGHAGVAFLIVDSYFEVRVLRTSGIRTPLLVIGHTPTETLTGNPFGDVAFTVGSLAQLKEIVAMDITVSPLHIKIDTGMHRQGIALAELSETMRIISGSSLSIQGLCSHLADSDGAAPDFTRAQIQEWNDAVKLWKTHSPETRWYHLSNTSGARYGKDIDANLFRLGLGLYGFECSDTVKDLRPALSMHTKITALRHIPAGEKVGYNCTFTAPRPTAVATIPIGYFEGMDRRLSNKGFVRIRGRECPVIGRVSMNMTTIDVTDLPLVKEGDEVEVIGTDLSSKNTAANIAGLCGTIPYDILVRIPAHLRRVVV
jgi:alanine racemase